ncbi:MAG: hypothetical protein ABII82_20025, partial [Verrucomicrobiota bacterium]
MNHLFLSLYAMSRVQLWRVFFASLVLVFFCPLHAIQGSDADFYGINEHPHIYASDHEALCDQIIASGTKWVRISPVWGDIETSKNVYNTAYIARIDAIVDRLTSHDVNVVWVLCYTASWASSAPTDAPYRSRYKPANWEDWDSFVTWATGHFGDRITNWEVWNEPDHHGFWKDT